MRSRPDLNRFNVLIVFVSRISSLLNIQASLLGCSNVTVYFVVYG